MNRVYVVVPLLLAAAFASFYVPWRVEEQKIFDLEGPGRLPKPADISWVSWYADGGLYSVNDAKTITSIISLLSPTYEDWSKPTRLQGGGSPLHFRFKASREVHVLRLGKDFAQSGPFERPIPINTSAEICRLMKTGRHVRLETD